jgi:hypothetical protein
LLKEDNMTYPFTPEEAEIIRAFDTGCRDTLMLELKQALPDVHQPDMKRAICGAIGKLADMTDEEFDALGLDDDLAWEEYE